MRRLNASLAFLAAGMLPGCSASLNGGSIAALPVTGAEVNGIPYRLREQLIVEVYRMTDKGYAPVGKQVEMLADPTRLYVLNFSGAPLSDSTLKIEQRPDGTLTAVSLSGAGKGAEMATSIAAGIDAVQAAQKAQAETAETAAKAAKAAVEAEATKAKTAADAATQAQLTALETRDAVVQLQLKLDEERATLKPSQVFAAQSAIRVARLKANTAAVAAGLPIPYLDVEE
jgi:hypothetical protein